MDLSDIINVFEEGTVQSNSSKRLQIWLIAPLDFCAIAFSEICLRATTERYLQLQGFHTWHASVSQTPDKHIPPNWQWSHVEGFWSQSLPLPVLPCVKAALKLSALLGSTCRLWQEASRCHPITAHFMHAKIKLQVVMRLELKCYTQTLLSCYNEHFKPLKGELSDWMMIELYSL